MNNLYPGTGTTLCPHCGTRFKIAKAQLEAHNGMVRCGYCHQTFDTRPNFTPDEADPQLELPIHDESEVQTEAPKAVYPEEQPTVNEPGSAEPSSAQEDILQSLTPNDQVVPMSEADDVVFLSKRSSRFWTVAAFPLLLLLAAQITYLFRVELAARLPGLKPALVQYCEILECSVPLPQKASLMSIESSELKDDPAHKNQILLTVLLRNRATYAQAFPNLELTLTDTQDYALARRIFRPEEYLPTTKSVAAGLQANQELGIRLPLETANLKPVGYRLMLFYTNS